MSPAALTSRSSIAFWFDASLLLAYVFLLSPRLTGLPVHEWLGLTFAAPVLVHVLLSWSWIRTATRRLLAAGTARGRFNYGVNTILFVLIVLEIFSGVMISQVALPFFGYATIDDRAWRALHNQMLNFILLAVGFHIAMNWRWISAALRRRVVRETRA